MGRSPLLPAILIPLSLTLAACGGGSTGPNNTPTVIAPPTAVASPISPPRGDATPLVEVTGLFSDPRPTLADEQRSLGPDPEHFGRAPFGSTMLYDVEAGTELDLGPGEPGRFSPNSRKMVWVANPQGRLGIGAVTVLDIVSRTQTVIATGRLAAFTDNDHVGVDTGDHGYVSIALANGDESPLMGNILGRDVNLTTTPDGNLLRREYASDSPYPKSTFTLTNPSADTTLLRIEAYLVVPAGHGTLAVAMVPEITSESDLTGYQTGTTNLFLIDVATGQSTFVGTSIWAAPNWSLAANDRYVVWTDGYCQNPQGHGRIYSREDQRITEIDAPLWPAFTPDGLILDGGFGGNALMDPVSLQYVVKIPAFDTTWSPDYRYASIGLSGGHGGLCP